MLLLAGLMGALAVGATAFMGIDFGNDDENRDVAPPGQDDLSPDIDTPDLFDVIARQEAEGVIAWGDEGDDSLTGGDGGDRLNGYAGDDRIAGGDGGDSLHGNDGQDTLWGEAGNDSLHGGAGDDSLLGGDGNDSIFGHGGADEIDGGTGDDSLQGSAGDDTVNGGAGDDAVHGGLDDDVLAGGDGADTLFGGLGNDVVDGSDDAETDYLNGGEGDDMILAGAGDIVTAGEGADTIALTDWLNKDHQAEVMDFSASDDSLMVIFDDGADPDPEVGIEADEDDADRQYITLNGVRIAAIIGADGLTLDHITLVPQSAADQMAVA